MVENEKLLEAARMIQEHCEQSKKGSACPLAYKGVCKGYIHCSVKGHGDDDTLPCDWILPKPCRWTENDVLMAKALIGLGYEKVEKMRCGGQPIARLTNDAAWFLDEAVFQSINAGETVNLYDIITEYEAR